jgi:hypothetical protein
MRAITRSYPLEELPGPSALAKKFSWPAKQCQTRANQNQCNILADVDREMEGSEMKRKGTIARARETAFEAGRSAAERTKVLAGEVANAAAAAGATAKAASTAAASAVLGTVATSIQVRAAKGANALARKGATTRSPAKKKVAKRVAAKKRTASKRKASTKKKSRKVAKKTR